MSVCTKENKRKSLRRASTNHSELETGEELRLVGGPGTLRCSPRSLELGTSKNPLSIVLANSRRWFYRLTLWSSASSTYPMVSEPYRHFPPGFRSRTTKHLWPPGAPWTASSLRSGWRVPKTTTDLPLLLFPSPQKVIQRWRLLSRGNLTPPSSPLLQKLHVIWPAVMCLSLSPSLSAQRSQERKHRGETSPGALLPHPTFAHSARQRPAIKRGGGARPPPPPPCREIRAAKRRASREDAYYYHSRCWKLKEEQGKQSKLIFV